MKVSQITYFNKYTLLCILLKGTKQAPSHLGSKIKQTYNFILLLQKPIHYTVTDEYVLKLFWESAVREIPR